MPHRASARCGNRLLWSTHTLAKTVAATKLNVVSLINDRALTPFSWQDCQCTSRAQRASLSGLGQGTRCSLHPCTDENIKRSDYSRRGWLVRDQTIPVCSLELNPSFS